MQKTPKSLKIHCTVWGNSNNDTGLELCPGILLFVLLNLITNGPRFNFCPYFIHVFWFWYFIFTEFSPIWLFCFYGYSVTLYFCSFNTHKVFLCLFFNPFLNSPFFRVTACLQTLVHHWFPDFSLIFLSLILGMECSTSNKIILVKSE